MTKMFFDGYSARCGKCRRILFKISGKSKVNGIEIKCHSCKEINVTEFHFCETCKHYSGDLCVCEHSECLMMERNKKDSCKCWEEH